MWKTLQATYPKDRDYPARVARLQALQRVLNGTVYEYLKYAAHEETNGSGEYIKLRDRRPAVRYNMCALAVGESVAMLFSDDHAPQIDHPDETTRDVLRKIASDCQLCASMADAATRGSIGSVTLWLRILEGRVYVDVLDTVYLTPAWNPKRPDKLLTVTERRKVKGSDLAAMGYAIADRDLSADHWWQRVWDDAAETWFVPQKTDVDKAPKVDAARTVKHALGFVPLVWIRNLPGGDAVDGSPTFCTEAIETQIELEYQLSQAARALRYASDPLLLIKEPATNPGGQMVRSASNAIVVSEKGDAKLVEIDGTATSAVLDYVRVLRDHTLEQLHATRVNPEKLGAANSGRALEILNQPLIWLAGKLRQSYGAGGLQKLLQMIVRVGSSSQLVNRDGSAVPKLANGDVTLKWPAWYPPTSADLSQIANTLRTHTDAGHMSQEAAVGITAPLYDIADTSAELGKIKADEAARAAQAPQIQEKIAA